MNQFRYLLETSTCIELLRGNEKVREKCIEHNMLYFNRIEGIEYEDWTV